MKASNNKFNSSFQKWKKDFWDHKYLILASVFFFVLAAIINFISSTFVDSITTVRVQDIILDNIPTLDLDTIFIWGVLTVIAVLVIYSVVFRMKELHRIISQISLLVIVRSFFISLTHLGEPAGAYIMPKVPVIYSLFTFNFSNDLFFSGHVAICFLGFLLFKKQKIRYFFLLASIVMAITVLFLHVHYSIDVFAAYFITYGTYKIGKWGLDKLN